jgi:hypothetical protein
LTAYQNQALRIGRQQNQRRVHRSRISGKRFLTAGRIKVASVAFTVTIKNRKQP